MSPSTRFPPPQELRLVSHCRSLVENYNRCALRAHETAWVRVPSSPGMVPSHLRIVMLRIWQG